MSDPRFQISIQYKQVGFYTGLSIGLVNYRSGFSGGVNECFSRVLHLIGCTNYLISNFGIDLSFEFLRFMSHINKR